MSTQYGRYPATVQDFATFSSFPTSAANGQLAVALDTSTLYIYNTTAAAWEAVGGSGVPLGVGTYDSKAPVANSLQIVANLLYGQSADATHPGMISTSTQTLAGNKTFTGSISASNLSGTNSGDVSLAAFGSTPNAIGLSLSSQALNLQPADATHPGGLSIADWNTFNNKQPAGSYITALTGDATASGPGSAVLTLATVNGNVGSFGTATQTSTFTVNAKGLITAASNTSIQIAESQVTNLVSDLAGKQATGNYITALTGDVTATGPGSVAATLATVNGNVGSFGSSTSIPSFTVNAKGLITAASGNAVIAPAGTLSGTTLNATVVSSSLTSVGTITTGVWNGTTIAIANGGTGQTTKVAAFDALSPMTTGGDLIYGGASGTGTRLANGSSGQVLTSNGGTTAPSWQTFTATSLPVAVLTDEQTSGTAGGTFSSGAWRTRVLNTKYDPNSIITSLSSNQFVLPAGTYHINAVAPAYAVNRHKAKLYNITDASDAVIGSSAYSTTGIADTDVETSDVIGIFTIAGAKTFEVQHQGQTTSTTNGFGIASSFSVVEVYTQVTITKIG